MQFITLLHSKPNTSHIGRYTIWHRYLLQLKIRLNLLMVIGLLKAIMQNVAFKKELLKNLAHCLVRGTEQNKKNVAMLNK